MHIGEES